MFLIAVVPTIAIHVVFFESGASRCLCLRRLFLVIAAIVPSGSFPATFGAVVASDAPQLLQELVINFEILGVGLGVVPDVRVGGVAAGRLLAAGGLLLAARVRVVGGGAGGAGGAGRGEQCGRGGGLAVRAEGDSLAARAGRAGRAGAAGRGRQGSGLHGRHPQRLVLLLLHGGLDLRARVRDVHARRDLRCKTK